MKNSYQKQVWRLELKDAKSRFKTAKASHAAARTDGDKKKYLKEMGDAAAEVARLDSLVKGR